MGRNGANDDTGSPMSPIGEEERKKLLIELSRPHHAEAWEGVSEEGWSSRLLDCWGEPICQALGLWLKTRDDPAVLRDELKYLSPAHGYWLEHADSMPLGFARLMVEAARREILVGSATWQESCRRALGYLKLKDLAEVAERRRLVDLQALGTAYLADGHRLSNEHLEAGELLREACRLLGDHTEVEIRVTILQLHAQWLRDDRSPASARLRLEEAAKLLSQDQMPGRWSELQLVRGLQFLNHAPKEALKVLRDALRCCPEDRARYLRFEVLHFLAAAEVRLGMLDQAEVHLNVAESYEAYGHPATLGQRLWLLGHLEAKKGRSEQAAGFFRKSLVAFRDLGCWRSAADAFIALMEVYIAADQVAEHAQEIVNWHSILLGTGELGRYSRSRLGKLRRRLVEKGVVIPGLDGFLAARNPFGEPPVN